MPIPPPVSSAARCLIVLALALLAWPSAGSAFPGDNIKHWQQWEKAQRFFPLGDAYGREPVPIGDGQFAISNEVMYFRPLSEDRILTYRLGRDHETKLIYYEEFNVSHRLDRFGNEISQDCKLAPLESYPSVTHFGDFLDREECRRAVGLDFTDLKGEALETVLKSIYGQRASELLSDLRQAKAVRSGQLHYKFDFQTNSRVRLSHGPIKVLYLKGKRFSYLVMPYGISMVQSQPPASCPQCSGPPFEQFLSEWSEDSRLHAKMQQLENQRQQDKDRSQPFDL